MDRVRLHAALALVEAERARRHVEVEVARRERDEATAWSYAERRRLRELVFGATRMRGRYDHIVARFSRKKQALDPRVRAVLHVALHEICETRSPDFATVDQAVRSVHHLKLQWARGFVNGLLRSVVREGPRSVFVDAEQDPIEHASTWLSHPRWLVERWHDRLGPDAMLELCAAQNRRPTTVLRAAPGRRSSLLDRLEEKEWEARPVAWAPDAVEMITRVPAAVLLAAVAQDVVIQDAAAQLVSPLLSESGVRRAADLCAAPGGKAIHLAQCLGQEASVLALDLSFERMRPMKTAIARVRPAARVEGVVCDGRSPAARDSSFDAVLVDAPCTGTGVLARRHEARWVRRPEDLRSLPILQRELLHRAIDLAAPGGWIVYATCSLESEENDEVVDRVLAERDDVVEVGVGEKVPPELLAGQRLQTWPHLHAADGAFAARLRRLPLSDARGARESRT